MRVFYRKREERITSRVIKDLERGFDLFKQKQITVNNIGTKCQFDDNQQELDEGNNSCEIFKDILNIGKELEYLIDDGQIDKLSIKGENFNYSYEPVIAYTLQKNIDEIKKITLDFIKKYGAFMTAFSKVNNSLQTFNVLEFLIRCYIIYEIHILYNCVFHSKPCKLKIFNHIYNFKIIKPNWENEDYSYIYDDRDKFFDIIDSKIKLLDKKSMAVKFLTVRDYEKYEDGSKIFNERWKTVIQFSTPLNIAIYELKLELSNNSETSFVVCKNPNCNNIFERESRKKKYCDDYECILSRQRYRKNISLNNKKISNN